MAGFLSTRMPLELKGGRSYPRVRDQPARSRDVARRHRCSRMDGALNAGFEQKHPPLSQGPPQSRHAGRSPAPGGLSVIVALTGTLNRRRHGFAAQSSPRPGDRPTGAGPRAPACALAGRRVVPRQPGPVRAPDRMGHSRTLRQPGQPGTGAGRRRSAPVAGTRVAGTRPSSQGRERQDFPEVGRLGRILQQPPASHRAPHCPAVSQAAAAAQGLAPPDCPQGGRRPLPPCRRRPPQSRERSDSVVRTPASGRPRPLERH